MTEKIKVQQIRLLNFEPKTKIANIEIMFKKGEKESKISKEYQLKSPDSLVTQIFTEIKSKDKLLIDNAALSPVERLNIYSPIIIENVDSTEEKVYNFMKTICEKAARMKSSKDAKEYMRIFDELKTISLKL